MDATFDNSLQRGTHRYDYFNLDDKHIFSDHEKLVLPVPKCTEDKGYYYRSVSLDKNGGCGKPGAPGAAKKTDAVRCSTGVAAD